MAIQMKYLIFLAFLTNIVISKNDCFLKGRTWSTEGQSDIIFQVTWKECINIFLEDKDAKGFTWYGNRSSLNRFTDVCVLFEKLEGEHSCETCISAKIIPDVHNGGNQKAGNLKPYYLNSARKLTDHEKIVGSIAIGIVVAMVS